MKKNRLSFWLGTSMGVAAFAIILFIIFSFPDIKNEVQPTAILHVTPYYPSATPSEQEQQTVSAAEQATALPGVFATDMRVQVANTEGHGLKIHSQPAIESDTLTIASEGSQWIIIEGPTIIEGRIWWKMWSEQSGITGWAVQEYLIAATE